MMKCDKTCQTTMKMDEKNEGMSNVMNKWKKDTLLKIYETNDKRLKVIKKK